MMESAATKCNKKKKKSNSIKSQYLFCEVVLNRRRRRRRMCVYVDVCFTAFFSVPIYGAQ